MKTDELREKYLEFFGSKGCVRRPSDVLVPVWDPSVLFTPAGMNQFKDHFLGKCKLEFTRAATCQKCLRTGDIDNVGRTAYHHTFFEMLGNFSFGDYFKREAIHWAWEFLTHKKWLGLDKNTLSVSVYLDDDEAAAIWRDEVGVAENRIERLGEDDNFWPAGAPTNGPDGVCGPCSEIFVHSPNGGSVEIWNLVFTQFNRVGSPPKNLRPLPSKNIDTGMGLERAASVLQGVDTNYHIDILRPIVNAAAEVCHLAYEPASDNGRRLRRIVDHVRAGTFAVHENVYPGPKKERYVIKRLLRRALLDGFIMGRREPFLHLLVPVVVAQMKNPYPELQDTVTRVAEVIRQEELSFLSTIEGGLSRIDSVFDKMKDSKKMMVDGEEAFTMYSTFGFPPELFETIASEHNFTFDWDGFRDAMQRHGEEDPTSGTKKELFKSGPLDALKKVMHGTEFLGYEHESSVAKVVAIIAGGKSCDAMDEIGHAEPVTVVLDKTPFYGESGGQVGDLGEIVGDAFRFEVTNTLRDGTFILHQGHLRSGVLSLGAACRGTIDSSRRNAIRRAHSATHVLHYALQKHLGRHAQQQGSKVEQDSLRFDFSNPSAVNTDVLTAIEDEVNQRIMSANPVSYQTIPLAEARSAGAMMLFGEKYPDMVRMVSMGEFSKELCGGTHVQNTGQIGLFRIASEESVSAGTRRISAWTGAEALAQVRKSESTLEEIAATLKAPTNELAQRVASLSKEVRDLKKQLASAGKSGEPSVDALLSQADRAGDAYVVVSEIPGSNDDALRNLIDRLRQKGGSVAALLATQVDERPVLVAGVSKDLQAKGAHAGQWVSAIAKILGGKGGGRPDMAQAGGGSSAKLAEVLKEAPQLLVKQLKA